MCCYYYTLVLLIPFCHLCSSRENISTAVITGFHTCGVQKRCNKKYNPDEATLKEPNYNGIYFTSVYWSAWVISASASYSGYFSRETDIRSVKWDLLFDSKDMQQNTSSTDIFYIQGDRLNEYNDIGFPPRVRVWKKGLGVLVCHSALTLVTPIRLKKNLRKYHMKIILKNPS